MGGVRAAAFAFRESPSLLGAAPTVETTGTVSVSDVSFDESQSASAWDRDGGLVGGWERPPVASRRNELLANCGEQVPRLEDPFELVFAAVVELDA